MLKGTKTLESSNIGISIHLLSFSFDKYLIKHDVRGIIMTYPETEKQEFIIKSKDIQFYYVFKSLFLNDIHKSYFLSYKEFH